MTPEELSALRRGEAAAIDRLYRDHARQVLGWVIRLGGPHLDAEDIAQEVFLVTVRQVGRFRGDSAVSTWLFGITRNVVANARRRAALRRFLRLADLPEPISSEPVPDARVERLRQRRVVQGALEQLSCKHREVLILVDLEERTAPEVAEMLGVAVGTVYSRLHHARRRFKAALEQRDPVGAGARGASERSP